MKRSTREMCRMTGYMAFGFAMCLQEPGDLTVAQATDEIITSACPTGTRVMKTPKMVYCVCVGKSCTGTGCRSAKHGGVQIHGFPDSCADCQCSESAATSLERLPDNHARAALDGLSHQLRVIYIKSYKVASTTISAILKRIQEEKGLRDANRYNAGMPMVAYAKGTYQMVFGHNFYDALTGGGFPCEVKLKQDGSWTQCGGYQAWMDHYVTDALHIIMVGDPLSRISSMYYYEEGYTKMRDRGPGDVSYSRINTDERFTDPTGADQEHIAKFLTSEHYYEKWERVQWWWIRDMTQDRVVDQAIQLLNERFMVGLTHKIDESLLMWKADLKLTTRDIIYTSMKASLPHPEFANWTEDNQAIAKKLITDNGDAAYYQAAVARFDRQVEKYGRSRLEADTARFRALRTKLFEMCKDVAIENENLHVPDQVYCMLRHYDRVYEKANLDKDQLGCYTELKSVAGRFTQKLFSSEMTLSACLRRCTKGENGEPFYSYFALAHGTHCYCGEFPPPDTGKTVDGECSIPCGGNPESICGGAVNYRVHVVPKRDDGWVDSIVSADDIQPMLA